MSGNALKTYTAGAYTLLMDYNALADLTKELGYSLQELFERAKNNPDIMSDPLILRAMFWAAIQEHHPCTLREAGRMMNDFSLEELAKHLVAAVEVAHPEAKKKTTAKAKTKK